MMLTFLRQVYFRFFILVFALYVYIDKGIAYSYLAEILLATGVLMIILNLRSYVYPAHKRMLLLLFFILLSGAYIVRGLGSYPVVEVIRDSFVFNYMAFAFIVFLFRDRIEDFKSSLFAVYKWYPVVQTIIFLISSYVPSLEDVGLTEGVGIFSHKFNNISTELLVSTLFYVTGYIKVNKKFFIINMVLIMYLFLVTSSYTRAGMLGFVLSLGLYFFHIRKSTLGKTIIGYFKYIPLALLLALPIYLSTNLEENFQGRKLGIEQLQQNAVSIFVSSDEKSLNDNKTWRLVWWATILQESFTNGQYFLIGKGLGINLAVDANVTQEDDALRSPHNFNLTVMARFGVIVFFIWLFWLFIQFKPLIWGKVDDFSYILLAIGFMFVFNASLDVFFEGPMAAFPFWTLVGLGYMHEIYGSKSRDNSGNGKEA